MERQKITFHDFEKSLSNEIRRINNSDLSKCDKNLLFAFERDLRVSGISISRIVKEIGTLRHFSRKLGKRFENATIDDLKKAIADIHRENYSIHTKYDYNKVVKKFYKWLYKMPKTKVQEEFARNLDWIKTRFPFSKYPLIKRSELLAEEDIHLLLKCCENNRDAAIIALAWDCGARPSEIGGMRIGSIKFDDDGTYVDLAPGKTGSRTVFIFEATPYIMRWLSMHPNEHDLDAPLWINFENKNALNYESYYRVFSRVFARAKEAHSLRKRWNPYLFRHSRATWCATNGWNHLEMCKFFGWTPESNMPAIYASLVNEDVQSRMRSSYGINTDKSKALEARKPIYCPRCQTLNPKGHNECYKCHCALNRASLSNKELSNKTANSLMEELVKDPEMLEKLAGILNELKAKQEIETKPVIRIDRN